MSSNVNYGGYQDKCWIIMIALLSSILLPFSSYMLCKSLFSAEAVVFFIIILIGNFHSVFTFFSSKSEATTKKKHIFKAIFIACSLISLGVYISISELALA